MLQKIMELNDFFFITETEFSKNANSATVMKEEFIQNRCFCLATMEFAFFGALTLLAHFLLKENHAIVAWFHRG